MSFHSRMTGAAAAAVILALAGLTGGFWYYDSGLVSASSLPAAQNGAPKTPALYCDFFDLTHGMTVVSFYFSVEAPDTAQPRYLERYVVEPDGSQIVYDGRETPVPRWVFSVDDGTPVITSQNRETQIKLYGLKPNALGTLWTEAGIRSNVYRNLEGKCRQSYFGRTRP